MKIAHKLNRLSRLYRLLSIVFVCILSVRVSAELYPGLSERVEEFNAALIAENIDAVSAITVPAEDGVFFPLNYYPRMGMEKWEILGVYGIMGEEARRSEKLLPYQKAFVVTRLEGPGRSPDSIRHLVALDYWFIDEGEWRVVPAELALSSGKFAFNTNFLQYFVQPREKAINRYQAHVASKEQLEALRDQAVEDAVIQMLQDSLN